MKAEFIPADQVLENAIVTEIVQATAHLDHSFKAVDMRLILIALAAKLELIMLEALKKRACKSEIENYLNTGQIDHSRNHRISYNKIWLTHLFRQELTNLNH